MIIRFIGLGLLLVCGLAIHWLLGLVHSVPSTTGVEMLAAALIVFTGLGGVLLVATGSELLTRP